MKFALLMYADAAATQAMLDGDRDLVARKHRAPVAELTACGELRDGTGRDYAWATTTPRWNDGVPVTSEAPFIEVRDQLTAHGVVACSTRERTLDFRVTAAEVRRIHSWPVGRPPPAPLVGGRDRR